MTDPTLKWLPEYRKWEAVWCDEVPGVLFRFLKYSRKNKQRVILCNQASLGKIKGTFPVSSICRASMQDFHKPRSAGFLKPSVEFLRICDEVRAEMVKRKS